MAYVTAVIHKSGTFRMVMWGESEKWPYFASFEWEGQIFVVHRSRQGKEWAVSHQGTGLKVEGSTAHTWRESIGKARAVLAIKGHRRLLAAIRKAKAHEGKDA